MRSKVSIIKLENPVSEKSITKGVERAIDQAGSFRELFAPGDLVLITPNLVAVPPNKRGGAVTNLQMVKAVADKVMEFGGEPLIGDSATAGVNTEAVIAAEGYDKLREKGYDVRDLKKGQEAHLEVKNGKNFDRIPVYRPVKEAAAIISVPVMKTHDQVEVSLGIKNLKGLLPDRVKKSLHHQFGVASGMADFYSALPPVYTVMDALVALEGLGPVYGTSVEMGLILAGRNALAVDTIASQIMEVEEEDRIIENEIRDRETINYETNPIYKGEIEVVGDYGDPRQVSRRFRRVKDLSADLIAEMHIPLKFFQGTCTGCKNTILSCLYDIKTAGWGSLFQKGKNKQIFAGAITQENEKNLLFQSRKNGKLLMIGACLADYRGYGEFVPGCPPDNLPVIEGLLGKGKVKPRYQETEKEIAKNDPLLFLKTIRGIIFDLDNTLIQSRIDFQKMKTEVFKFLKEKDLLPERIKQSELAQHTTSTLIQAVKEEKLLNEIQELELWQLVKTIEAEGMRKSELEPGAEQLIKTLKNQVTLTIFTNNSVFAAKEALKRLGILSEFDLIVGREQIQTLKPSGEGIFQVIQAFPGIHHEQWLFIGDSWIDGMAAKNANILFTAYQCCRKELVDREIPVLCHLNHLEDLLLFLQCSDGKK